MTDDRYELYRDQAGNVVTLTWDQVQAVWRAYFIWCQVVAKAKGTPPDMNNSANWQKSCLLARMLIEGRPPLPEPPPVVNAAPAYWLVDPDLCPSCGGERADSGREMGRGWDPAAKTVSVVICAQDWHPKPPFFPQFKGEIPAASEMSP